MSEHSSREAETSLTQEEAGGRCRYCASPGLRRSRFRSGDVLYLLLLQWPVRCMACSKRQHMFVGTASKAISSRAAHNGEFRSQETWHTYTGSGGPPDKSRDEDLH